MAKIGNLTAITGTYTNAQGEEKKQYLRCGVLFKNDKGEYSIKLDAVPLGEFNGWINIYPDSPRDSKPAPQQQKTDDFDDQVPF